MCYKKVDKRKTVWVCFLTPTKRKSQALLFLTYSVVKKYFIILVFNIFRDTFMLACIFLMINKYSTLLS